MKHLKRISAVLCILIAVTFTVPMALPESIISETSTAVYAASKIKLNKTKATVKKGAALQLTLKGTKKKAKWSSSNKKVAVVNSNGKVTAKAKGTATITAKVSKKQYKCRITVKEGKTPQPVPAPIPTHQHAYMTQLIAPTCTEQGYTTYICSDCGDSYNDHYVAALGHNYIETVVNATKDQSGYTLHTCSRCQDSYKDNYTSFQLDETQVYSDMTALKTKYPEGMPWDNSNYYRWNGGIYSGGYGCAGFAFILSDAAFGNLPARTHQDFDKIRVGDIIRMNNEFGGHSVIVLEVYSNSVVVAEGNYNRSIHWGRQISLYEILSAGEYVMTRYPK